MNTFQQHIPAYVELGEPPPKRSFSTTEELLSLDIVKRYGKRPDFSHFAMSGHHLMEISDGGHHWLVVGYIEDPTSVDLPQWEGGKYRAELPDGRVVQLTGGINGEVVSSCGDELTLRDGSKARYIRSPEPDMVPLPPEEAVAAVMAECDRMFAHPAFAETWARELARARAEIRREVLKDEDL